MELHKSDTLQNKIDFPSIRENVIFCKKENKKPVFFHRSSGNKTKTSQNFLPVVCTVSECALVGPSADEDGDSWYTCQEGRSDKETLASPSRQPL